MKAFMIEGKVFADPMLLPTLEGGNTNEGSLGGQSKLCTRGRWRPAEDSKLKDLVALYSPKNWNIIA